jgi:hypothetical protein
MMACTASPYVTESNVVDGRRRHGATGFDREVATGRGGVQVCDPPPVGARCVGSVTEK